MLETEKQSPRVSIIIPVHNGKSFLDRLLCSIESQTYKNYELVIINNNSSDGSAEILESYKNKIPLKIINCDKNDGYCGGCNTGIENSKGELLLFLSQDRIMSDDWISKSVSAIHDNAKIGCVFGRVVTDGMSYAEYGAAYDIYGSPCMKGSNEETNLFYAGGCILTRRTVIDEIGAFDQEFFMYQEDIDLCWRMHIAGYDISCAEGIESQNIGGGTSNTFYVDEKLHVSFDSELIAMPEYRFYHGISKNRIRVMLKNYSSKNIIKRLPIALVLIILHGTFMAVKTKKISYVGLAFKGMFWNILKMRDTLIERRRIQSFRAVNDEHIERKMIKKSIELESIRQ